MEHREIYRVNGLVCQGECHLHGGHKGPVRIATVYKGSNLYSPIPLDGWDFNYCDTAIQIDRNKGFEVND